MSLPRRSRPRRAPSLAALAALLALGAPACKGAPEVNQSRLAVCVLQGAAVADGCAADAAGAPVIDFGTVAFGRFASKVVAVRSYFDAEPAVVSQVSLAGGAPENLHLSLVTTEGGAEQPATLPLTLAPRGSASGAELLIRVTFEADPAGALPPLRITVASPGHEEVVPVSGVAAERVTVPFAAPVSCLGWEYCETASVDVCAQLPDLRPGDAFAAEYSNEGSSWSSKHVATAPFTRGTAYTHVDRTTGDKANTTSVVYDGACGLRAWSSYCCASSDFKTCEVQLRSLAYVVP